MPYRTERVSGRCRQASHPAPPSKQPPGQGALYVSEDREMTMSKLRPYATHDKVHEVHPAAIDTMLSNYAGYIRYCSKVHGKVNAEVEEHIKQQLIAALFKFRFDR